MRDLIYSSSLKPWQVSGFKRALKSWWSARRRAKNSRKADSLRRTSPAQHSSAERSDAAPTMNPRHPAFDYLQRLFQIMRIVTRQLSLLAVRRWKKQPTLGHLLLRDGL